MRMLYALAWLLALPFLFLYLLWRARKQPEYLRHWNERLGRGPLSAGKRRILLHAVSVGETRAATPLLQALRTRHPDYEILLTHTTPTGRSTGKELFGEVVAQCYLPYDFAPLVRRFLNRTRPDCCIVMETEIWPAFFAACARRGIPVYLVNARLSERSAQGYARIRGLVSPALGRLDGIAAQTDADAARLASLGAIHTQITGNLKFDVAAPVGAETVADHLRQMFQGKFVLLAASTRDGEEALLLEAVRRLDRPDVLLVIVPRHPQRFNQVAGLLRDTGWPWHRRSDPGAPPDGMRLFLGDSMGEMAAYYTAADLAYIGGSLLPFGGQNLIEAAAAGCPALIGPHTWNFEEAAEQAVMAGCAWRVADGEALLAALRTLIDDRERRRAMAEAGRRFAAANRGATERVLAMVEAGLAGRATPTP